MENTRKLKRGDWLFKEGDAVDSVYLIQSGRIQLLLDRGNKKVELETLGQGKILGEQGVLGPARFTFSAEATASAEVLELPIAVLKLQYEKAAPGVKLLAKGMGEALKQARQTVRSLKMEQDSSPCPQRNIPRLFAILTLVAQQFGTKEESGELSLSWSKLKLFTHRMFLESPQRMQNCLELLENIGYAKLSWEDPEEEGAEPELDDVTLFNVELLEHFSEFYQYNLYKGGRAEPIYVDPMALQVAKALLGVAKDVELDRWGALNLEYQGMLQSLKQDHQLDLKATHLNLLEKKGLFVKRTSRDDGGVFMSFDKGEFERVVGFWEIIREIDRWNERGYVAKSEDSEVSGEGGSSSCPDCQTEVTEEQKFCANCGFKLAA